MLGKFFHKKEQTAEIAEEQAVKTSALKKMFSLKPVSDQPVKWPVLKCLAYWLLAFACWELLVHATVFGQFHPRFLYALGFGGAIACLVTVVVSLVPGKLRFAANMLLTVVLVFVYGSQMVYEFIFGTLYSAAQMEIGGAALTSFWRETLTTIAEKLPYLAVLLVPVVGLLLLRKFQYGMFR